MEITQAALAALRTTFSNLFQGGYSQSPVWNPRVATEVPSASASNTYGWLDVLPKMRKWVGPRMYSNLKERKQVVLNDDYECSVKVDRNDILDDNLNIYSMTIPMLGRAARKWRDQLLRDLIELGTATICFDGQFFFDVDHPIDIDGGISGVQINSFSTAAGTGATPLNLANYAAMRAKMRNFKGADGEKLGVNPEVLMVPSALEETASNLINADFIPNSSGNATQQNTLKGTAEVLVNPDLTSDTAWYLLDTTYPIRPFGFQIRQEPTMQMAISPTDPAVFDERIFKFGEDGRGNAFYGPWFLALRADT
jgi:phage major head subunit gpT-like protein